MTSKQYVLESLEKQKNLDRSDDATAIKKEWLTALHDLYVKLSLWLNDAIERKLLEIKPGQVGINEERIGGYYAPSWDILTPSGIVVHVLPKARFVVGANGRVDMQCAPNEAILLRKNANEWGFAELDATKGWRFVPLTEESFWEILGRFIG